MNEKYPENDYSFVQRQILWNFFELNKRFPNSSDTFTWDCPWFKGIKKNQYRHPCTRTHRECDKERQEKTSIVKVNQSKRDEKTLYTGYVYGKTNRYYMSTRNHTIAVSGFRKYFFNRHTNATDYVAYYDRKIGNIGYQVEFFFG